MSIPSFVVDAYLQRLIKSELTMRDFCVSKETLRGDWRSLKNDSVIFYENGVRYMLYVKLDHLRIWCIWWANTTPAYGSRVCPGWACIKNE